MITDDTINRKTAIDAIYKCTDIYVNNLPIMIDKAEAYKAISELPPAQPDPQPIGYADCANAMLKMWMDGVVTDGEYNRIMDKLNAHEKERRTDEQAD